MGGQLASFWDWLRNRLSLLGDLMILNFLLILCCIPVVTAGAAEVACYSCIIRILRGEKVGMSVSIFFRDFAANFKKATIGWLIELACLLILAGDAWFALYYSETGNTFFLVFAIVLAAVIFLASVWFYPLIARFENKIKSHIKNSFLMALAHFPKTLLALLVQAAVLAIPFFLFDIFATIGWFWLSFGLSLPLYLTAKLFRDTLQCYPKKPDTEQ